jgi:subtilisin family serine protease
MSMKKVSYTKFIEAIFISLMGVGVVFLSIGAFNYCFRIKVAVVDSGINQSHPLFKNRQTFAQNLSMAFTDAKDTHNHGSHVSGIIARNTPNEIEIHSLKNLFNEDDNNIFQSSNDDGYEEAKNLNSGLNEFFSDYLSAINYAVNNKIKIINISQTITTSLTDNQIWMLKNVFSYAQEKGILIIAASGNERHNLNIKNRFDIAYPCALKLDNVICVGNLDQHGYIQSNYGNTVVDVWANGTNVLSASKDNNSIFMTGSSMAAPKITSLAARIWNQNKLANYKEIKEKVYSSLKYNRVLKQYSTQGLYLAE